jgi:hypothetical protein
MGEFTLRAGEGVMEVPFGLAGNGTGVRVRTLLELTGFRAGSFAIADAGGTGRTAEVVALPAEELAGGALLLGLALVFEAESLVPEFAPVADEFAGVASS